MPDWMTKLVQEWSVISGAPMSFVSAVVILCGLIWMILNWSYGSRLATRDDQIALLVRQRDDYRDKLGGASPDQAAQKISDLEKRIELLTVNRWVPLTAFEMSEVQRDLKNVKWVPEQVDVMCSLAACDDLAESLVKLLDSIGWKALRHGTYFSDGIKSGIELWSKDDNAQQIGEAIERGTRGRLKISFKKWGPNTSVNERQISLVVGRKP